MDWNDLKQDYERLGTWSAVAAEYGVSKGTISVQAKKQGLTDKPRALRIDWGDLPNLYGNGMTYDQLAAHYGCSVHAVQNAVKRMDVAPRPTGLPTGYEWTDERRAAHREATSRPEFRAKSRENLLKRLPTMRGPSANSPLERLIQAALVKVGISFSTQRVLLSRYCVDVLIQQAPVVIEADGAIHHLRKVQDAERDAALNAAGYRVFRFNGSRINTDPDRCIREVIEVCGLTSDTDPVADIRNGMIGSENPHWGGGARLVTCDHCGNEFRERQRNTRSGKKTFCKSECYGNWLRAHPEASNRLLKIDWSELPSLYANGMTIQQLCDHYGRSKNAVRGAMLRLGVVARPVGRPRQ